MLISVWEAREQEGEWVRNAAAGKVIESKTCCGLWAAHCVNGRVSARLTDSSITTSPVQGSLVNLTHQDPFICVSCMRIDTHHTSPTSSVCYVCVCECAPVTSPLSLCFYYCLWLSRLPCGLSGFYSNPATLSLRQRARVASSGFAGALWRVTGDAAGKTHQDCNGLVVAQQ